MTNIWQVRYRWTGFTGAPGFTNLFFQGTAGTPAEALAAVTKAKILFDGLAAWVPSPVVMAPDTDVRLLDDVTGDLVTIVTVSGIAPSNAAATATNAGPAGGCIDWLTSTVHGSRRLQGRTFVVPLTTIAYQADGSLVASTVSQFATAAEAMRTASGPTFGVWGRPRAAQPLHVPPISARDGLWGPAISSRVPDKTVVLRSRRD